MPNPVAATVANRLLRFTNRKPWIKRIQQSYIRNVGVQWTSLLAGHRILADNIQSVVSLEPDRGVILASNHRSFFDQYFMMQALYANKIGWIDRLFFPVRSNFFYDSFAGMMVNYFAGMGAMYPPISRDTKQAAANKLAVEELISELKHPGTMVGIHPEGRRNKGPNPYELLPAQPGIGQIAIQSKAIVIPLFSHGASNDIRQTFRDGKDRSQRQINPIILCFGEPIDYSEFLTKKPRLALYKRCADKVRQSILDLSYREKELRAACAGGEISDDDPRWTKQP